MGYVKADDVLPQKLLSAVQQYIDGMYLYIPRNPDGRKKWGEVKHTRELLAVRNRELYGKYLTGVSVPDLADHYCLADKTVYRILARMKQEQS